MSTWVEIGPLEQVPLLGARVVQTPTGDIAVFRTASGEPFALKDRCPHKDGPLSQGIVHGKTVTCPLHNWKIALDTGVAAAPDEGCASTYPVKVENGTVYLNLEADA